MKHRLTNFTFPFIGGANFLTMTPNVCWFASVGAITTIKITVMPIALNAMLIFEFIQVMIFIYN
jgi:hypothetical protein